MVATNELYPTDQALYVLSAGSSVDHLSVWQKEIKTLMLEKLFNDFAVYIYICVYVRAESYRHIVFGYVGRYFQLIFRHSRI